MSYLKEYKIVPKESFKVIRNCSGCGVKTNYRNTLKFRVNANGNKLDVWLIYQCEKCKHTYNLSIYRGQKSNTISTDEYQRFWANDELLADEYGKNYEFFKLNRAEVKSSEVDYELIALHALDHCDSDGEQTKIIVHNPYELKIRSEKQAASILELSRSQVDKLIEQNELVMESVTSKCLVMNYCTDKAHDTLLNESD